MLATDDASGASKRFDSRVELVAPNVVLIAVEGYLEAATGHSLAAALDRRLEASRGAVHVFCDVERVDNYHSDVRTELTRVLLAHRPKIASMQVLVRSKIVKMGVAVANLSLGGLIRSCESRSLFEGALAQVKAEGGRGSNEPDGEPPSK